MATPAGEARALECQRIRSAQRGDLGAFRELIDRYDRRLLYFVRRFCPDPHLALDVLQEVWVTLWRRLPELRVPEAFRVWLYQIAHDKAVSQLRRSRREEQARAVLRDSGNHQADPDWEPSIDQADLVHRGLAELTAEHRAVLTLRFLEDLSLEEIAESLRISLGTVKSRLHYAKLALREEVEKRVHGPSR